MVKFSLPLPSLVTSGKSLQSISQKIERDTGYIRIFQALSAQQAVGDLSTPGWLVWEPVRGRSTEPKGPSWGRLYQLQPGACL